LNFSPSSPAYGPVYRITGGFLNATLKIPSGQIGSAREWYYWIGLEKDIKIAGEISIVLWVAAQK
jgi:hypothetical protein